MKRTLPLRDGTSFAGEKSARAWMFFILSLKRAMFLDVSEMVMHFHPQAQLPYISISSIIQAASIGSSCRPDASFACAEMTIPELTMLQIAHVQSRTRLWCTYV
jgi:hypothetical protein